MVSQYVLNKMDKPQTIYFNKTDNNADEITAWCSMRMTGYYFVLSVRKISYAVNRIVHIHAWLVLFVMALLFFLVSSTCIHLARAERDKACQRQYKLEQQIESLNCQLEVSDGKIH